MKKLAIGAVFICLVVGAAMLIGRFSGDIGTTSETVPLPERQKGIQLYSLRDIIGDSILFADNHVQTLDRLKEYGYTAVEAACYSDGKFYGLEPEQYKAAVEAAGLKPLSSHAGHCLSDEEIAAHDFTDALQWWKQSIKAHKAAGMTYVITPWDRTPTTIEQAQTLCDYHNEIGKLCNVEGIKYGYHSHSHEFRPIGQEDTLWYDYLVSHTDPENVFFQLDTYWCVMAGKSPVEYFKKYPGRFDLLHIKDQYEIGGSGMVGFDAIFSNDSVAGFRDYIVEIERTDGTMDIFQTCQKSAEYLNKINK